MNESEILVPMLMFAAIVEAAFLAFILGKLLNEERKVKDLTTTIDAILHEDGVLQNWVAKDFARLHGKLKTK